MVYNSKIIKFLFKELKKLKIPIIVDPVIKSTTGGMLIEKSALNDFKKYMVPISTIITPNKFEAEIITNSKVSASNKIEKIAKRIQSMGAENVIVTGIEKDKDQIEDFILEKNSKYSISGKKTFTENHGSGCTYSALIAYSLANKKRQQSQSKLQEKLGAGFTSRAIQSRIHSKKSYHQEFRNLLRLEISIR